MILTLQIFELTERQQRQQNEADEDEEIEINLKECDLVDHTFYEVSYIKPLDNGKFCLISSGGDLFSVNESYMSVKGKIQDQKVIQLN